MCAQGLCKDAKPTKHTQTLTLRKARGIVRVWKGWCGARGCSNPSVLTAKSLVNKKGGCIASKTQQSDSLCLAVNPPPFDKGGKCDGAKQGIVRFWKGWCGSKGIEIDRSANIKASEALTIPTVTARNSFIIIKVGLSEYCATRQKLISAVPPPLFRGEARVMVLGTNDSITVAI
mgnify:CR=1 FL=1